MKIDQKQDIEMVALWATGLYLKKTCFQK